MEEDSQSAETYSYIITSLVNTIIICIRITAEPPRNIVFIPFNIILVNDMPKIYIKYYSSYIKSDGLIIISFKCVCETFFNIIP